MCPYRRRPDKIDWPSVVFMTLAAASVVAVMLI